MQLHSVAMRPCQTQHCRPHGRDGDRHHRQICNFGHKMRRHQAEAVMLAGIIRRRLLLPGAPDRTQHLDILPHPRCGRRPGHTEPPFIMPLHLGAETQLEASARCQLQVVRHTGHRHRRTGKGNRDPGHQFDPLGHRRGDGKRQEGIVRILHHPDRIEAG